MAVRFADEDLWLTQNQLAEIYCTTQQNIASHIANIYKDEELSEGTHKKFLLVQTEGTRQVKRNIDHYNLDMIIALGYRVQSQVAVRFRRWATQRLHEYIQKGFAMDDERPSSYNGLVSCFVYQWVELPEHISISDLIDAIVADTLNLLSIYTN